VAGAHVLNDASGSTDGEERTNNTADGDDIGRKERPPGAKRQKLMDRNAEKESKLHKEVKGMKEAMKKAASQSSQNFQQLLDIQLLDRMDSGQDKEELWNSIVCERKLRIKQRTQMLAQDMQSKRGSINNSSVTESWVEQSNLTPTTGSLVFCEEEVRAVLEVVKLLEQEDEN